MQATPQFKIRFSPAKMSIAGYIEPEDRKCATLILDSCSWERSKAQQSKAQALHCCEPVLESQFLHAFKKLKKSKEIFHLDQYNLSTFVWWYFQKLLLVSTTSGFLCMSNSRQNLLTQCLVVECWCMHRKSRDSDMAPAWERSCAGFTSVGLPMEK